MNFCHGTGDKKADTLRFIFWWFLIVFCVATTGSLVLIAFYEFKSIELSGFRMIVFAFFLAAAVLTIPYAVSAVWLTTTYDISADGFVFRTLFRKSAVSWDQITNVQVLPVNLLTHGLSRQYIVLFLTQDRNWYTTPDLFTCWIRRRKFILIRYSDLRLKALKNCCERIDGDR